MRVIDTQRRLRRPGFTLVELLVVILIISILATLGISAAIRLLGSQEKGNTETMISPLASILDMQMKAAVDTIRKDEVVSTTALSLATYTDASNKPIGQDNNLSKIIYLKLRLRQEFPSSYYEATTPIGVQPAKAAYRSVIDFSKPQPTPTNPPALLPTAPPFRAPSVDTNGNSIESSVLLYIALTQSRRGVASFNPEEAVGTQYVRQIASTNGDGTVFSYFVDSYGYPLRFYNFPASNVELNSVPYIPASSALMSIDPQDPQGLLPGRIKNKNQPLSQGAIQSIKSVLYDPTPTLYNYGTPNLIPAIMSVGKDGLPGYAEPNLDHTMSLPTATSSQADDNIMSYRLRKSGQRGD